MLKPEFDPQTRNYTAIVTAAATVVTFDARCDQPDGGRRHNVG